MTSSSGRAVEPPPYCGWVWLSKVKEGKEFLNSTFILSNFHKRKKRWLSLSTSECHYSHHSDGKDPKSIPLILLSPLIVLGADDLPTLIYLIDTITRNIHVIIEPDDVTKTSTLCTQLTIVSNQSRVVAMIQIINEDDSDKLTELFNYCRHTKALMEDLNFSSHGTALHYTLYKVSVRCLPIVFFTLGTTSLSIENHQSLLPVHVAVLTGNDSLLKTFLQIVSSYGLSASDLFNMTNTSLQSVLHFLEDEEMIPFLAQHEAHLDTFDANGLTPLMTACLKKLTYVAIEFMDYGVNLNKPCWVNGFTPLMFSCRPGNDELVKEILDRNADIHQLDNYHRSPLHHACMNGHLFSCVMLLNLGINLDLQDIFGATALCYAAASTAVTETKDELKGKTPESIAVTGSPTSHLRDGAVPTSQEIIGLLLARGSYPKIRDVCGRQALQYAAGKTFPPRSFPPPSSQRPHLTRP
jgi:ankyrin repeat protein